LTTDSLKKSVFKLQTSNSSWRREGFSLLWGRDDDAQRCRSKMKAICLCKYRKILTSLINLRQFPMQITMGCALLMTPTRAGSTNDDAGCFDDIRRSMLANHDMLTTLSCDDFEPIRTIGAG
jgi:hypothetical protein